MPRPATTNPDALLDGAMTLVQEHGLAGITIDAVAKQAGVSKGAVLHYFPSKSALLLALVRQFAERVRTGIEERTAKDHKPGALLRAFLDLSLPEGDGDGQGHGKGDGKGDRSNDVERMMQALLAAAVHDPALLQPMKAIGTALRDRMLADRERGLSDLLLVMARDGMLLWQMHGFLERGDPLSRRLMRELRRRAAAGATP